MFKQCWGTALANLQIQFVKWQLHACWAQLHPFANSHVHVQWDCLDLGPQISYRGVFVAEYLGPMLFVMLYYYRPAFVYGAQAVTGTSTF